MCAQTLRKNFFHSAVLFSRSSLLKVHTPSCRMSSTFPASDSRPGRSPGVVENFLAKLLQAFGAVRRHPLSENGSKMVQKATLERDESFAESAKSPIPVKKVFSKTGCDA